MNLTDVEEKLLRLGLDKAAKTGEIDASAIKFFRQLRKRKVSFEELTGDNNKSSDFFSIFAEMFKMEKENREPDPDPDNEDWKEIAIKQQTKIKTQERRIKQLEQELIRKKK